VGPLVVRVLGADQVVIHPNRTAVQTAAARLKLAWQDAAIISLHGRTYAPLAAALGGVGPIFIYTDPVHSPAKIAGFLMDRGWGQARICVLEDLGQDTERITWLTPGQVREREFSPLNLVVVLPAPEEAGPGRPRLHLGLPEAALAHQAGLVTKSEVRAVVLAKLHLAPGHILWDVGAGCGSVGLEASLLLGGGRIFAVERHPERAAQIAANRDRFRVGNLEVVQGAAPACLQDLPDPHRVFMGGGGPLAGAILREVLGRLAPGGRVVISAALLETVETARAVLMQAGWAAEVVQVQMSRSHPLAGGTALQALNPVWIITGYVSAQ
jgi:precorrin-6Y C5,15-methyltransferase (decarboxylating)